MKGKQKLSVLEDSFLFTLIIKLNEKEEHTLLEISNQYEKDQSSIYRRLKRLKDEGFVSVIDNKYKLNYEKLIEEFIKFSYDKGEPTQNNILYEEMKKITDYRKNIILKNIIKTSLKYEDYNYLSMILGEDKKNLKLVFNGIIRAIVRGLYDDMFDNYNLNVKDFYVYDSSRDARANEIINKFKDKDMGLFFLQFSFIIHNIQHLSLDFDENLKEDLEDSVYNSIKDYLSK